MSQSQGYKRFRSSIDTINHGTSTPQAPKTKVFPRASTPNRRSIEQPTMPVPVSSPPRVKPTVHRKISRKHRSQRYQIYVDQIILIQRERKSCSRCHGKTRHSQRVIGIL